MDRVFAVPTDSPTDSPTDQAPEPAVATQAQDVLGQARATVEAGDAAGTIRVLRAMPDAPLLADGDMFATVTGLVAAAARTAGYRDLAAAAEAAQAGPDDSHALYRYGHSCVERGVAYLAVPALLRAVARAPRAPVVRMELVTALELEARHGEAVTALSAAGFGSHDPSDRWIEHYLLIFNSLLAGDADGARERYLQLSAAQDRRQEVLRTRLDGMLSRARLVIGADGFEEPWERPEEPRAPLGSADLRGWHFVLNGTVLATLSPYGADAGMNGRYAYLAETYSSCHWALHRLAVILAAAGRRVPTVGLLTDRSSRILGMAAAQVLGVQAWDWRPQMEGALVVAYSLSGTASHVLHGLGLPGSQVLVEHATTWTDPPALAADASGLLHQVVVPPWGARQVPSQDGESWVEEPADGRPERDIAADILAAPAVPDPGDGSGPDDSDDVLAAFVDRIAPLWATGQTHRDRVWSPGPVRSSRFW